jgi:antitoxin (DNA-binding transcriptional repressor) of toxin-antitoxin stability system/predicted nucleic acid-binding protein
MLPDVLTRVERGEQIVITRHGRPVAVVIRPDALRTRKAESIIGEAERVHDLLAAARSAPLPTSEGLLPERAEALVRAIRARLSLMNAFDADVLIYAAVPGHPLGRRVRALFPTSPLQEDDQRAGVGSWLLLPEVLGKPLRDGAADEARTLAGLLSRLDLRPIDAVTAEVAVTLAGSRRLRAADAAHLATALVAGADCYVTNNRKDFPKSIKEIDIVYPEDLPDPMPPLR